METVRKLIRTAGISTAPEGWQHTFEVIDDNGRGTNEFVHIVTGSINTFRPLERVTMITPS